MSMIQKGDCFQDQDRDDFFGTSEHHPESAALSMHRTVSIRMPIHSQCMFVH